MRNEAFFIILINLLVFKIYLKETGKKLKLENFNLFQKQKYSSIITYEEYDKNENLNILKEEDKVNSFFFRENIICNKKNCKYPYGKCLNNSICKCLEGFVSFSKTLKKNSTKILKDEIYCDYRQKKQIIAFFLELFFICGFGIFYLERFSQGILKFFIFFCFLVVVFLIKKYNIRFKFFLNENIYNGRNFLLNFLRIFLFLLFFSLHVIDIFYLSTNSFLDGNEVLVYSWEKDLKKFLSLAFKNKYL